MKYLIHIIFLSELFCQVYQFEINSIPNMETPLSMNGDGTKIVGTNFNGQIQLAHGANIFNCRALELIKPEVGKFILFPNYMLHTVYPFYGPGERRSFSFNADIALKK